MRVACHERTGLVHRTAISPLARARQPAGLERRAGPRSMGPPGIASAVDSACTVRLACLPARSRDGPAVVGRGGDAHDRASCRSVVRPPERRTSSPPAPALGQRRGDRDAGGHGRHEGSGAHRRDRRSRAGAPPPPVPTRAGPRAARARDRAPSPSMGESTRDRAPAPASILRPPCAHVGSRRRRGGDMPWAGWAVSTGGRLPARAREPWPSAATAWRGDGAASLAPRARPGRLATRARVRARAYRTAVESSPAAGTAGCCAGAIRTGQKSEGQVGTDERVDFRVAQCGGPGARGGPGRQVHSRRRLGCERPHRSGRSGGRPRR
jgi:hypothetical protein